MIEKTQFSCRTAFFFVLLHAKCFVKSFELQKIYIIPLFSTTFVGTNSGGCCVAFWAASARRDHVAK